MRISDWSSDVCSSDLCLGILQVAAAAAEVEQRQRGAGAGAVGVAAILEQARQGAAERADRARQRDRWEERRARRTDIGVLSDQQVFGAQHVGTAQRSEEHTSELQSLMRISYAVFCLKKKKTNNV